MLHDWRIFDKPGLLWSAAVIMLFHRHWQGFWQEPERNGRHERDGASNEVAQPPRTHPAGVTGSDGDGLCEGISAPSAHLVDSFCFTCLSLTTIMYLLKSYIYSFVMQENSRDVVST